jgi:hypothetical protein
MKRLALMLAVVTVAAACSPSADSSVSADSSQSTANSSATVDSTESAAASQPDAESTSTSIGDDGASLVPAPTIPPDAPPAPDFTMALADGDTFTLSEQAMPVYMIFWAEW